VFVALFLVFDICAQWQVTISDKRIDMRTAHIYSFVTYASALQDLSAIRVEKETPYWNEKPTSTMKHITSNQTSNENVYEVKYFCGSLPSHYNNTTVNSTKTIRYDMIEVLNVDSKSVFSLTCTQSKKDIKKEETSLLRKKSDPLCLSILWSRTGCRTLSCLRYERVWSKIFLWFYTPSFTKLHLNINIALKLPKTVSR